MLEKTFRARELRTTSGCARQLASPRSRGRPIESERAPSNEVLVLVVTDLVGFTPLVSKLGDLEARRVMRQHNHLLRDGLRTHKGTEVVHTGDGILAAFRSVTAALEFAALAQRRLLEYSETHRDSPLRIRAGVHAGEPLAEDGRLFGACVNQAVRICAAADAGSVLVSDVVRMLASGKPSVLLDRGCFQLKGMLDPIRLHELVWRAPVIEEEATQVRCIPGALRERHA